METGEWPYGNIHTVGDSHSLFSVRTKKCQLTYDYKYSREGVNMWVPIRAHHLGSRIMHSFGLKGDKDNKIQKNFIAPGDVILFCLGEIDVRGQFYGQEKKGRNLEEIISPLVENYINRIKIIEEELGIVPVIFGVVPTEKVDEGRRGARGPKERRVKYTLDLNMALKIACQDQHILYLDVYDHYCTSEGYLNPSQSRGRHIIHPHNAYVKQNLCDLIWEFSNS